MVRHLRWPFLSRPRRSTFTYTTFLTVCPLPSDSLLARILACGDGLAATMNSDGEG